MSGTPPQALLIACHYFHPHVGGIETVAAQEAERLAARGWRVVVAATRHDRHLPLAEARDGYLVRRWPSLNPFERFGVPWPVPLRAALDLPEAPRAVLVHSQGFLTSALGLRLAEGHRARSVLLQHNVEIAYRWPWSLLQGWNDRLLSRWNLARAHVLFGASAASARYAARLSGRAVGVLRCGVDARRFRPAPSPEERARARARFAVGADECVAVTLRRLVFKNGLGLLLQAAARTPGVRYLVAGSGPDREALRAQAPPNVRLLGFVPDEELPLLLQAADLFVLPSLPGEGTPMAVLEAMASALPVVATDSGGHVEVMDGCGRVVPCHDAGPLAAAVLAYALAPEERLRAGREGRARVEAEFDWERHLDVLEAALRGGAVAGEAAA